TALSLLQVSNELTRRPKPSSPEALSRLCLDMNIRGHLCVLREPYVTFILDGVGGRPVGCAPALGVLAEQHGGHSLGPNRDLPALADLSSRGHGDTPGSHQGSGHDGPDDFRGGAHVGCSPG